MKRRKYVLSPFKGQPEGVRRNFFVFQSSKNADMIDNDKKTVYSKCV